MGSSGSRQAADRGVVSILLVEDNPADALLVSKALEGRICFKLTCFDTAEKTVASLAKLARVPDVILLDLGLPMSDGIDVLGAIRATPGWEAVPVMILTSSVSPADKQRTRLLGAARYIVKPTRLEDFLEQVGGGVEELLQSRKQTGTS